MRKNRETYFSKFHSQESKNAHHITNLNEWSSQENNLKKNITPLFQGWIAQYGQALPQIKVDKAQEDVNKIILLKKNLMMQ